MALGGWLCEGHCVHAVIICLTAGLEPFLHQMDKQSTEPQCTRSSLLFGNPASVHEYTGEIMVVFDQIKDSLDGIFLDSFCAVAKSFIVETAE